MCVCVCLNISPSLCIYKCFLFLLIREFYSELLDGTRNKETEK